MKELEPQKTFLPEPDADESGVDSSDDESEPEPDQGGQSGAHEMSRLTRDGTAKTVSRDQILRRERGQENINFPCSADPGQDGQGKPYPVDPYSCYI